MNLLTGLRSFPHILSHALAVSVVPCLLTFISRTLAPQRSPGYWCAGVIAGATFLKHVLVYLRPKFPLVWVLEEWIADLTIVFLTLVFSIVG